MQSAMRDLVIFGAKNFAEVAHYYFTNDSPRRVAGFTVDGAFAAETMFCGLPVTPFEELPAAFPPDRYDLFVAVGIGHVNEQRAAKVAAAEKLGYRLASFLSTKADVHPDLVLQPNSMIMERCTLQPRVQVGKNSILWSTTRVGFRTHIGDHCWVVCSLFGEQVTVGDYSFVGLGATVAPGVTLGRSTVVGAGALVMKDTPDYSVHRGQRAEVLPKSSQTLWRGEGSP